MEALHNITKGNDSHYTSAKQKWSSKPLFTLLTPVITQTGLEDPIFGSMELEMGVDFEPNILALSNFK